MKQRLPGQPQPRPRGRKRTLRPAILRAATRLFVRGGFERPTMDDVAMAAGVRKATLYSYFDAKSALVDAVVDRLLQGLPAPRPVDGALSLHEQLIGVGLQLRRLATHPATVPLAVRLAERRLTAEQMAAWRTRYEEFENFLAGLFERHCDCDHPRQVAQLFLLLVAGGLRSGAATLQLVDPPRIESAVDLILLAYPQRCSSRR